MIQTKIDIGKLVDCNWDYIATIERLVGEAIATILNNTLPGFGDVLFPQPTLTTGNNPCYDFTINKCAFELKCSGIKDKLRVEFMSGGLPSGIITSTAQYYVFVNPGMSKMGDQWNEVYKVRIIPRAILLHRLIKLAKTPEVLYSDGTGNSEWYELDAKALPDDGWFADITFQQNKSANDELEVRIEKQAKSEWIKQLGAACMLGIAQIN